MTKKYVDLVRIYVGVFPDGPLPEHFMEGQVFEYGVGGHIDRDQIVEAIEKKLIRKPFTLSDKYSHFSWGADGAALEIVVGVISGAAGGAVGVVVDRLLQKLGGETPKHAAVDAEWASSKARETLARFLEMPEHSIRVVGLETESGACRVDLDAKGERYSASLDTRGLIKLARS